MVTAANGFDAVKLAKKQSFDLILMDIRMDGMDGIETTKQIKQSEPNKETPVIAVSAETFAIERHPDFCASLLKPVNQEELTQVLADFSQNQQNFNHHKALEISHHDEDIVLHLRQLFMEQLKAFKSDVMRLFAEQEFDLLQDKLHQLLGSAKICAAEQIITQTIKLKQQLKNNDVNLNQTLQQLITVIEEAENSAL